MFYAIQYYNGYKMVCDKTNLSLEEATKLFHSFKDSFREDLESKLDAEICIWESFSEKEPYATRLHNINSYNCEVIGGLVYQLRDAFPAVFA